MQQAKLNDLDEHPSEEHLEVHPAIALLIARMGSHPHEFYRFSPDHGPTATIGNNNRVGTHCSQTVEGTKGLWNRKEKRLYNLALRNVRLEEAHKRLMAILLTK